MDKKIPKEGIFCFLKSYKLLRVPFFLHLVHQILSEFSVGFDHIGDESKDKELDTDDKENTGREEVV